MAPVLGARLHLLRTGEMVTATASVGRSYRLLSSAAGLHGPTQSYRFPLVLSGRVLPLSWRVGPSVGEASVGDPFYSFTAAGGC